ncbi:MAG: SH3 domain-containing protein [Chloroflexota bacterium]
MSRAPIKIALLTVPLTVAVGIAVLTITLLMSAHPAPAQPTPIPTVLPANSETRVEMTPGSATHLYNFSSASQTRLKLNSRTPGFAFAAKIRTAAGQTIASFDSLSEDVQMTLAPNNYLIDVSAANPQQAGTVGIDLGSAVIAPQTLDGTAYRVADCRVTNAVGVNALIRSAPAAKYAILGTLAVDGSLPVIGRTDNDWYTVNFAERQGWITGDVVALDGDCGSLPLVRNPAIPSAPADAQASLLEVDRDGSGRFHDAISAPDGDTSDLIWVRIINLDTQPPNNYREFALTLDCTGTGVDAVRWGSAYAPNLTCGDSIVLPFLSGNSQQPIVVLLPPGSLQSYVEYTLSALPGKVEG